jgi:predicted transposase/invertase (TIGR01784 family)
MMFEVVEKYINPFTDFGFKKIFGNEENTEPLKSLLNDILHLENNKKIKNITFKNGEFLPDSPEDRRAIFDLFCEDNNGDFFIVELQKMYQEFFQSRALYYTTFPIQQQASRGKWDFRLTPVYFIGLLNFKVNEFGDSYIHHGKITDIYTKKVMYEELNMIYIEIPKFKKQKTELSNHLEWWIWFFQNLTKVDDIPDELKGDVIADAFDIAEFSKMKRVEQDKYQMNLKVYRDLVNSFDTATKDGWKLGLRQGLQEGLQEGLEKGLEQGVKQGLEQGLEKGEKQAKIEIAKNSLSLGLDINTVLKLTGLTIEEIKNLTQV